MKRGSNLLGDSEVTRFLRESYRPGENFGSAFARLFSRLFADWGVILLDASDPEFHQIAAPIYQAAIERAAELDNALLARGKELEAAGYHQQVKVTPSSTLLFMLRDGARIPVQRRSNGGAEPDLSGGGREDSPRRDAAPDQIGTTTVQRQRFCCGPWCRIIRRPLCPTSAGPRK